MWSVEQLIVKATPLVLIGAGLSVCYLANVWNIGAEGQLTVGAIAGSAIPILFPTWQSPLTLASMMLLGILGGMAYGAIPGYLKNRFNANEILTSLMLVYVAQLFLDWIVRGPLARSAGLQLSENPSPSKAGNCCRTLSGAIHLGCLFALIAVIALALVMGKTLKGFEIRVAGNAPRAGRFAGFSREKMVMFLLPLVGRPCRTCRHHRGRQHGRATSAANLAGLWLRGDHRRFFSAVSIRSACFFAGLLLALSLYRRRGCANLARHFRQDRARLSGHPALFHPRLRYVDPLSHPH